MDLEKIGKTRKRIIINNERNRESKEQVKEYETGRDNVERWHKE